MSKTKTKKSKIQCVKCTGLCCRYYALPIETPEDWDDYDDVRWYLCHEDTSVFIEEGDWYLNVQNKCMNLGDNNQCAIYDLRPKICRGYKMDECDFTGNDYDYELHFTSAHQMEEYMKIKFGDKVFSKLEPKKKKKKKKKKKQS